MKLPLLTKELAYRIEYSDYEVMSGRMKAIGRRTGNPFQVEFAPFGEAVALSAQHLPSDFNKLWEFGPRDLSRLSEIIRYYDARNPDFGLDLIPARYDGRIALALQDKGFYQAGFHTAFYGIPYDSDASIPRAVSIGKCGADQAGIFAELFHRSLELPADIAENEESFRILLEDPCWSLYVGYFEGVPASFSMMYTSHDGIACCGMAGTLPEFRGRGLQSAMLAARLQDAKNQGCRLVTAQSEYGTSSFRNLLKAGFHVAYTKTVWRRQLGNEVEF